MDDKPAKYIVIFEDIKFQIAVFIFDETFYFQWLHLIHK